MADILALAAGVFTFAALCGGYALLQSYRAAGERLSRERDAIGVRPGMGGGRYIGGQNRPGEN